MSTANERFEAIGALYYSRHHYLRPGKSDVFYDTSCDENRTRFENWLATEGFTDAINRIIELEDKVETLNERIDEINEQLEDLPGRDA